MSATNIRPDYYHARVRVTDIRQKDSMVAQQEAVADIECIDLINALGLDFHQGNALKYLWRAWRKGKDPLEDYRKARTYIDLAIAKAEVEK